MTETSVRNLLLQPREGSHYCVPNDAVLSPQPVKPTSPPTDTTPFPRSPVGGEPPKTPTMGSDTPSRSLETPLPRPVDPMHARARRNLSASAAARTGIATMIDTLRISKPPRAPQKPGTLSATTARRHALIPLAEGREELEARIRMLEDAVSSRDVDMIKLKKQLGRSLIKRRHMQKERDVVAGRYSTLLMGAKECNAGLIGARGDLQTLVEDLEVPVTYVRRLMADNPRINEQLVNDVSASLDDITSALDIARVKLDRITPEIMFDSPVQPASSTAFGKVRPMRASSTVGSDDDAKSCLSFASSTVGEDREGTLETLAELVEILEAKLSASSSRNSMPGLTRAKRTVANARGETAVIIAERDRLKEALNAVMREKRRAGGIDAALASAAKAETELQDARREVEEMRARLSSMEKIAERVIKVDEVVARHDVLASELRSAKKTVGRLVQERNSLRRTTPLTPSTSITGAVRGSGSGKSDAMRRILDWRKRAAGDNKPLPQPVFEDDKNADAARGRQENGRIAQKGALPDRETDTLARNGPLKKRRVTPFDSQSLNRSENHSIVDSIDVIANDATSAQSMPVRGFLKRHDSFLSGGGMSASGDEITIMNNRNMFATRGRPQEGVGLLMLLRGSPQSARNVQKR